jgi:hypothetical protein
MPSNLCLFSASWLLLDWLAFDPKIEGIYYSENSVDLQTAEMHCILDDEDFVSVVSMYLEFVRFSVQYRQITFF